MTRIISVKKKIHLVEEERVVEIVATDECEETDVGEAGGEGEGELDHHVVGPMGGSARADKVGGGGDKGAEEEEEGSRDHYMLSIGLVDTHPPKVGPEAPKLIVSAGEVACMRHPTK
ncbi:hypothetical protein BHE74_00050389 [Ensete ventricosum]|nr:hypothetical protein BHE74_00050389 [Ensete ventricosum]RZS20231.1 hypothetical protein BHM03_00052722 [Ensete ventricosum]